MRIIGLLKITSLEKMSLFELCTLEVIENNLHISCDQNPELNEVRANYYYFIEKLHWT